MNETVPFPNKIIYASEIETEPKCTGCTCPDCPDVCDNPDDCPDHPERAYNKGGEW